MNSPKICLTIDTEPDCPPYLQSFRGIEEGLPALFEILKKNAIPCTFFTTGKIAERFPEAIRRIVDEGHELGCHGHTHRRFDQMNEAEARQEIQNSTEILRKYAPVRSFRAPNLKFPPSFLPLLEEFGFNLDSSEAKYKLGFYRSTKAFGSIRRIPASTTSSVLRLPRRLRHFILSRLSSPVVLFVHPWEFVDLRGENLRWDCRYNTGQGALNSLQESIQFFRTRGGNFLTMEQLS